MKKNKFGKFYCKIVLTGGPCAGKSTAQRLIADRILADFSDRWRVFVVSEASSLLYKGRVKRAAMNEVQVEQWQEDILRTIIQLENVYEHIAENEELRNTIIICDRGAMDPKAYATEDQWCRILEKVGVTEQDILARYQYVIQIAIAPREYYIGIQNNPYRRESFEEAQEKDEKYNLIWKDHPNLIKITNEQATHNLEEGWNKKFADIFEVIQQILSKANGSNY
uniref:NadR/Ttd14 AAA domain-containing protein n=1 Tax=Ditylenchus dipsaci TaxID=166011 RepID=A0A915E164_9BILA